MTNLEEKSSMGLKPNIAAMLSYLLVWIIGFVSSSIINFIVIGQMIPGWFQGVPDGTKEQLISKIQIAGIISLVIGGVFTTGAGFVFFTMEKVSRFVRVHTIQAILFNILSISVSILLSIMTIALGAGIAVFGILVSIAFLVVWIWLIVRAYKGDMLKLPVISEQAENIVAK